MAAQEPHGSNDLPTRQSLNSRGVSDHPAAQDRLDSNDLDHRCPFLLRSHRYPLFRLNVATEIGLAGRCSCAACDAWLLL